MADNNPTEFTNAELNTTSGSDGVVFISGNNEISVFNESAKRITGFTDKDVIGKSFTHFFGISGEDHECFYDSLKHGSTYSNISMDIKCSGTKSKNVSVSITPVKHPKKEITGIIVMFRDTQEMMSLLHQLNNKNHELEAERNKLDAIFRSRVEGTFTVDKDWNIILFNKSAERITGYKKEEAVGKKCWEIFCKEKNLDSCPLDKAIKENVPSGFVEFEVIQKNGVKIPVRVNAAPLYDKLGKRIGAVETFQDLSEIRNLRNHVQANYKFENIIGRSKSMQGLYSLIENVMQTDSIVLITGESGTGKELIARAIHLNSENKDGPFIPVNCSAFAETLMESELFGHEKGAFTGAIKSKPGRFELAKGGTLFLDEIGDISTALQVKLLRILETRKFERVGGTETIELNARIISATNKDLEKAVEEGNFREDFYYRINVINVDIPPLRDRKEDLSLLIEHLLQKFRTRFKKDILGISLEVMNYLTHYNWPGNIRELENVLEHAFIVCHDDTIKSEHLPPRILEKCNLKQETVKDIKEIDSLEMDKQHLMNAEKQTITETLKAHNFKRGKTAEALGIDKSTLWRKMKKYKIR